MNQSHQNQIVFEKQQSIGLIKINYPPVNALSQSVRQGLIEGIEQFEQDQSVKAIVICCDGKTFIAGADIKEFGKPPTTPLLPEVVNRIEAANKPVIASMFGTSLGGGFEVALACHYRVALENAKVGMPEVNLGLIPGAGGTQRLPRVVGMERALKMITSGKHYSATEFSDTSLFDAIFESDADLEQSTISFVESLISQGTIKIERVGERIIEKMPESWQQQVTKVGKRAKGKDAPVVAARVLTETQGMNIFDGMSVEREAFLELRESEQSAALRFAFGAEKKAAKTELSATAQKVESVGIIGGGNMGSGIATAFLAAGFSVVLIEQNETALSAGTTRIENNFSGNVKRARMTQSQADLCLGKLTAAIDYSCLAKVDLVIEAVFEDIQVKKDLFEKLERICHQDCILATNTSYLDIDEIGTVLKRPQQLIGMHFFSPANIMKLLEVVRASKSSETALSTGMAVAKKLKKVSVLVGVCFGFAGNRMYTRYGREIQQMLLEGAKIEQIDAAMTEWGMAMGPLAVQDLSGIDIGHNARSAQPFPEHDPGYFRAAAVMVENGRLGRKTAKGFYQYDDQGRMSPSVEAARLITEKANSLSILQRDFSAEEIVERALLALICEGLSLFKEGIVQRLSDIDVVWLHGYGFPRHKGGPMFQAQQMGASRVSSLIQELRMQAGDKIWPEVDVTLL